MFLSSSGVMIVFSRFGTVWWVASCRKIGEGELATISSTSRSVLVSDFKPLVDLSSVRLWAKRSGPKFFFNLN